MKTTMIGAAFLLLGMLAPSFAQEKSKDFTSSVGAKMIWVKPGSVKVNPKTIADDDEFKQVTVKSGYYLAATEVTQAQYQAVMGSNPSNFKGSKRPVEGVGWHEAMEYCRRLTEKDRAAGKLPKGYVYTLPTEVQWEYACRAGTIQNYSGPKGNHNGKLENIANCHVPELAEANITFNVAENKPNLWGFYDMHGNVEEWCLERNKDGHRAVRGGSCFSDPEECRSGYRNWLPETPDFGDIVGFRPAAVPSSK